MARPGQQPNMQNMLKQVQQLQSQMLAEQEKLKDEVVEASVGGGMVKVKITGDLVVKEVVIDSQALDPEDPDMVQDLVVAATNEAIRSAQELANSRLGGLTQGLGGGLGLPGM